MDALYEMPFNVVRCVQKRVNGRYLADHILRNWILRKIGVFAKNTLALLSLSRVKADIFHFGACVQVGKCEPEPVATLSSGSWGSGRELIWSGHFGGTDR